MDGLQGLTVVIVAAAVLVVILIIKGVIIVRQSETVVVERLGKFHRVLDAGINVIWPIIDRPREIDWVYVATSVDGARILRKVKVRRIDLRETVYDFPRQGVITRDNVMTEINALLYFQLTDPMKAVYEIANLPDAIEKLTQTTLRNVIGEMDLDQTLSSRETINAKLRAILDEASDKWGVKVNRVELQEINPPPDIRSALEKQMRAERDKRATVLEAEGVRQGQILRADGEKQSQVLVAEGQAQARVLVAQAEAEAIAKITGEISKSGGDPAQYLIAVRYIETLKEMVSGRDNKAVYIPYEATGVLAALGGIKDLLGKKG